MDFVSSPSFNSKNYPAESGKMRSAEIIKNRVVPHETKKFDKLFETSFRGYAGTDRIQDEVEIFFLIF